MTGRGLVRMREQENLRVAEDLAGAQSSAERQIGPTVSSVQASTIAP